MAQALSIRFRPKQNTAMSAAPHRGAGGRARGHRLVCGLGESGPGRAVEARGSLLGSPAHLLLLPIFPEYSEA